MRTVNWRARILAGVPPEVPADALAVIVNGAEYRDLFSPSMIAQAEREGDEARIRRPGTPQEVAPIDYAYVADVDRALNSVTRVSA